MFAQTQVLKMVIDEYYASHVSKATAQRMSVVRDGGNFL